MAERSLTVKIIGDESDLLRSFRSSSRASQRFTASFGTFLKGAVIFEGVRTGINLIGDAVRAGTREFAEASKVTAQTNAVLRSTQGIANVTARDIEKLSGNLRSLSGIDDELIQSGANLILTFKNVRNEIGRGNAIFDRATKAAVDLSVAGFGAIDTTAKQLGKALNDPVRGMTALRRAGVTFTKDQEALVKELVETNRTLDAQRLILREVESQVGGSAKALGDTLPGQLSKVREAFRNAFGNLVGVVAEPLARVLGAFANLVPEIERGVARISATVGPALGDVVDAFTARLPELQRIATSLLDPLREHVFPILRQFGQIATQVWANVVAVFDKNRQSISTILDNLGSVLANVWTVARPTIVFLFQKALPTALNIAIPIIEKLTGITKLMSDIFVRSVRVIVQVLDAFLGALSKLTDAASHLPFIGDQFAGISDKVNVTREGLRQFGADLDALDGRQVNVSISVDVTTGRREEGALGRAANPKSQVEEKTKREVDAIKQETRGAKQIESSSIVAVKQTERATSAVERQRDAAEKLRNALRVKHEQRQGAQFEQLGLTGAGQPRIPGVGALRQRLGNLRDQVAGTVLDTAKTQSQLDRIARVLSGKFGKVGRDVRQAILGMFNTITDALGGGSAGEGLGTEITPGGIRPLGRLIAGLNLTEEQIAQLERNMQRRRHGRPVNAFGMDFDGGSMSKTVRGFSGMGDFGPPNVFVTVEIDGQKVTGVVKKQLQKTGKRRTNRRGGAGAGRGAIL